MTLLHALSIFAAGLVGATMNSIAGGGTLVTFPTLVWHGLPPIHANATSTLSLWPGSLGASWGYREELRNVPRRVLLLVLPSLMGGLVGAILLRLTPERVFESMVPFLILFATLLFMVQEPLQRRLGGGSDRSSARWFLGASLLQLLAATYGGYFGAGMGIVMLANLGLAGLSDIHQMNGLKNLCGFATNFIAAVYFVAAGLVHWPEALIMMAGAVTGGYGCAGVARRLGRRFARRAVIVIGFAIGISFLVRR